MKKHVKEKVNPDHVGEVLKEIGFDCETLLNNINDGVAIVNNQGYIVFQNTVSRQRTGMSFKGLHFSKIVSDNDLDSANLLFERAMSGEQRAPFEFTHSKPDGEELTVEFSARTILRDGKAIAFVVVSRDITERRKMEAALRQSEEKYRILVDHSLEGIAIAQGLPPRLIFANPALAELLGYTVEELTSLEPDQLATLVDVEYQDMFWGRYRDRVQGKSVPPQYEVLVVRKDGRKRWIEMFANRIEYHGEPAVQAVFIDITERKLAREALKSAHDELEERVKERTTQLEEVNSALRVLLKQRDRDKAELENKVVLNVKELVVPYAEKLRTRLTDEKQIAYLNVLESNLNDIISPFAHKLSSRYSSLSPMEIRTAQFIKDGRTSKEIADLLNLSSRTIESHRKNIRTKMGLHGRKANLRSYLLSM
ncbi:MAG: PAS domain S-box protein [Deltaproteobacteria bacterium]|nr:PAS domain S-box protein [Deltaproteobacteria bacterium]